MQIKRKNVARLASLSALGAGALGVTAGTAQADVIVSKPSSPVLVGFGPGGAGTTSEYKMAVASRAFSVFARSRTGFINFAKSTWRVDIQGGSSSFDLLNNPVKKNFMNVFGPGAKWSTAAGNPGTFLHIATRGRTESIKKSYWNSGNNEVSQYALFAFRDAHSVDHYGWLQLDIAVSNGAGPLITIDEWAYEEDGDELIPAGDTGVPEPSTMATTGLAALLLGAAGLRRWRAARKPAA